MARPHDREAALVEAEAAVAASPGALEPLYARARALDALGRDEAASQAYLDVLRADANHLGALVDLGTLAFKTGHRGAAATAFRRAVAAHPRSAAGYAKMGILLSEEDDPSRARAYFETALRLDPEDGIARRGLAILLLRTGDAEGAARQGRAGFGGGVDVWEYRGAGEPVRLLLVVSALGHNVPIDPFLDDRVFQKCTLTAEFFDPAAPIPRHDVVFNAIGDADGCARELDVVASALARTAAPVLNPPARVRATGRAENAARFRRIPGVVAARAAAWPRASLSAASGPKTLEDAGFTWPLLLRSAGFHGGEHFVKVERPEDVTAAVAPLPGETFFVLDFLDTRGADGCYRKYRVMMVGGALYPLHLAVSPSWKVHYFSSDMAERADHREEEDAFLRDMPRVIGPEAMRALERVRETMELDYGGIDFTIDGEGRVVVFEANATMVIAAPGDDDRWAYRRAPVDRVRDAVRRMLLTAAGRSGDVGPSA